MMKVTKKLRFICLMVGAGIAVGQTNDKNTLLQIAQGDRITLKKDLDIPANTDRLYFGLKIDSGYKNSGCALVLVSSQKSRRIPGGSQLMFSGITHQQKVLNEFHNTDFTYSAEIMSSETVVSVECYGTSFQSQYQDLYVSGMKKELNEFFEFVPAEPEITK